METKIINWKEEFTKLFPESTERKLKDNHKWCDKCNGLGFSRKGIYIEFCTTCRGNGQIGLCTEGCGREQQHGYTVCDICRAKKDFTSKSEAEKLAFEKATKIKFADYDGKFLDDERAIDADEFADNFYYRMKDGEDYPTYVYGTVKRPIMGINFTDVINDACEDGYEEMTEYLNYEGVSEIQKAIDQWIEKQGDNNYCYDETNKIVVLLDDLIEEIKEQIEKENHKEKT